MIYVAIVSLPLVLLGILLAVKGTAVKVTDDTVTIGFTRYSTAAHTFSLKKLWIRPVRRVILRCALQVEVFEDNRHIRTHTITALKDEAAADALIAKFEDCCRTVRPSQGETANGL